MTAVYGAAHDLAPILEKTFGIRLRELDKNTSFRKLLRKYALELPSGQPFEGFRRKNGVKAERKSKTKKSRGS